MLHVSGFCIMLDPNWPSWMLFWQQPRCRSIHHVSFMFYVFVVWWCLHRPCTSTQGSGRSWGRCEHTTQWQRLLGWHTTGLEAGAGLCAGEMGGGAEGNNGRLRGGKEASGEGKSYAQARCDTTRKSIVRR